jgi:non-canonical (house-cleaning) NTP pyrophosphatase
MPFNPPPVSRSPKSIGVAGASKIKIEAVQAVVDRMGLHSSVNGIAGAESGIGEQPNGEAQIFQGALNRALSAKAADPRFDAYIGIENGVVRVEDDEELGTGWFDYACCLLLLPRWQSIRWVDSAKCEFPEQAVLHALAKPGGFELHTVGKSLQELGVVRRHQDPHLDLCGKSRQDILVEAVGYLLDSLPINWS